jgi:glyoxylase-like metal-dependent hydrolase (beta-lactamase superfamily II)
MVVPVQTLPTLFLGGDEGNEITYELTSSGELRAPLVPGTPSLTFRVLNHLGEESSAWAISRGDPPLAAGQSRAPAAELVRRFEAGEIVLEPVLLAAARAVARGVPIERAAAQPVRVEPAPGVLVVPLRTPTLPPATHTNAVLIGDSELTLIEPATPYPDEQARLEALLAELAASGRRVRALVVTHHHNDHVGAAAAMRERLNVPLYAHPETARRLPVTIDEVLDEGDELAGLRVLHTPGHAPGHLCLLEPRTRTLVAGDMVAGQGTILIVPADDGDMAVYLESLRRLAELDLHVVVPAHGPTIARPRKLFLHYIAHRLQREQRVVDALSNGPQDAAALLPIVYADTDRAAWPIAAVSLDAHLRKLISERRVAQNGAVYELTDAP